MKLFASGLALLTLLACNRAPPADEDDSSYSFTTIEYPGAARTVASDIDEQGRVVGWFAAGDTVRGYIYANGEFSVIHYPGAIVTQVTSIASDGSVSGAFRRPGDPGVAWHAFVRRPSGEFVDVHHPQHPHSMAQGLLDDGTIVGCYHDDNFTTSMYGMIVRGDDIVVHRTAGSMNNGASPDGRQVVGNLSVARRGFVADGDRVTHLEAPGSVATEAWDINASGVIVGAHVDSADVSRAYVLRNGRWTTLEVPQARASVAFGINSRGEIAGSWEDSTGVRRGFVARKEGEARGQ